MSAATVPSASLRPAQAGKTVLGPATPNEAKSLLTNQQVETKVGLKAIIMGMSPAFFMVLGT